jgi:Uma2 family endonuclease
MTIAKSRFSSFEAYLALGPADLPEGRYEYWDGELIEVMSESGFNDEIANYLYFLLLTSGIAPSLIRPHSCEIEVPGRPRTRFPDLVILDEVHVALIDRRNTITRDMPAPRVVVEVVSPGKQNRDRDLVAKRQQYGDRGIPEYWLIDPEHRCITVLALNAAGSYIEIGTFHDVAIIISPMFPELKLTVEQVLRAGR